MEALVAMVFEACISSTIPNPFTINNLTDEQKIVIYRYTELKCNEEASLYASQLQEPDETSCKEGKLGECM